MKLFFLEEKWIIFYIIAGLTVGCSQPDNLRWHQEQGYRWAKISTGYFGKTGFKKVSPSATNISFENRVTEESITQNRNYLNGSGVAAGDVDGDGLVDLYFAQLDGPNKLYKNIGGLQFKDITEKAGVAHEGYSSTGVVFVDVDNDGDPDLLVTSLTETNELYINDGTGRFTLKDDSGLGPSRGSNTMALADIDQDGDLDLYISNYKLKTARDIYSAEELSMQHTVRKQGDSLVVVPPYDQYYGIIKTDNRSYRNEYGARDELYLNNGDGKFQKAEDLVHRFWDDQGQPRGLVRDWGLTARFHDLNGDMLPDLYVANDFWTPDRLWINQGTGVFKSIGRNAIRTLSYSAMAVDFSDINRDGAVDFFVTEMLSRDHSRRMQQLSEYLDPIEGRPQYNRNSLYLNRGDNTFAEISAFSNLSATEWSWATSFLDVDLDGYEDLVIATGHAYDYQDMDTQLQMDRQPAQAMRATGDLLEYPRLPLQNKIFRNNHDLTFTDRSTDWGFGEQDVSLGMAVADLDNDGDPDLVMNRLNETATLYQNKTTAPRIAVRLHGNITNTAGIGAKIELLGAGVSQTKELGAGGTYVSGSEPIAFFAADENNTNHHLKITWPGGKISSIDSVKANRIYMVDESSAIGSSRGTEDGLAEEMPLFRDISDRIDHTHHEDEYTDFNVQAMLPVKISEKGPGVSWIDYDRDGDQDLFIASGKGASLSVFENKGNGRLDEVHLDGLDHDAPGDQTTLLGWAEGNGTQLIIGSANFEQGDPRASSAYRYEIDGEQGSIRSSNIPGILSTTGPLAASDYDSDGNVDLFVGGSFNPAQYPQDATSRLFKNKDGSFRTDQANSHKLAKVGLVSGAVFTDFDRDGDQDLLISREWDSLLLFENDGGSYRDISTSTGLAEYEGWWNGVATGDFNNDGLPDIVAANIGQNSAYQLVNNKPLKLFYSDFNMDGQVDIIDSYYSPEQQGYVPRRKLYAFDSMPTVLRHITSYEQFAGSTVDQIFGEDFSKVPSKEVNTLQHMLFLNTGGRFEAHPLPAYAQFSTAFHVGVLDFDNDGNEDLFLSQNLFPFPTYIPRQDAGRGLLLKGDGTGGFDVVKGQKSGIKIYGEQRGAAVADFNRDARADLAVSQNEGHTKLYLNQGEQKGIRIRLEGPASNRDAIGSSLRLVYKDGSKGPVREIQAGSGYWSQSAFTQVMGRAGKVSSVEVRWFDGSSETVSISPNETERVIKYRD